MQENFMEALPPLLRYSEEGYSPRFFSFDPAEPLEEEEEGEWGFIYKFLSNSYSTSSIAKMCNDAPYKEEEDVECITKWVDDYLRKILRQSSSMGQYLFHIERDKQKLEYLMDHDPSFHRFIASKILSNRVNQLYRMLFMRILGRSSLDGEERESKKLKVSIDGGERMVFKTIPVILEKLRDMLSKQPVTNHEVELKEKKALWKMILDLLEEKKTGVQMFLDVTHKHKDDKYIKIWVDEYIRNIQHVSSSIESYLDRIKCDKERLEAFRKDALINGFSDGMIARFTPYKMLMERVNQLYRKFFVEVRGKLAEFKGLQDAKCFYDWRDDDLRSTRDDEDRVVGRLTVTNNQIGVGSNGTVVFRGRFQRRPVAVKRLLKTNHNLISKEIEHLIESDEHQNIVRYFGVESDRDFYYICLELCKWSLYDLFSMNFEGENELKLWTSNGFPSMLLIKLMRDIASGVTHLHMRIIHRDLKPQNVLVIKPTSTRVVAKISDMGISKKLSGNQTSTKHATRYGSSGWQPREVVLRCESQTEEVDLFSLGCIFFFCITQGKHPFGEDFARDANIVDDKKDLSLIVHIPEAVDLITRLLDSNPKLRPKANEVINHPLFWASNMRISFFQDASESPYRGSKFSATKDIARSCFGWYTVERKDRQCRLERALST